MVDKLNVVIYNLKHSLNKSQFSLNNTKDKQKGAKDESNTL